MQSPDLAVEQIWQEGVYGLYHDLWPYKLAGKKGVSEKDREVIDRIFLFLKTDMEYEWPKDINEHGESDLEEIGDLSVWPFISVEKYEQARSLK